MKRLAVAFALLSVASTAAGAAPRDVVVTSARVHVADVVADADGASGAVDIGPSPTAGGSRVITRAEIVAALTAKDIAAPADVPVAVRVVRKAKHLLPADVEAIVRTAVARKTLPRGVSLSAVRLGHPVDVADGWIRVEVDVPRPPKRAGAFTTTAIASFYAPEGDVTARLPVPVELAISDEGATFDAARGSAITLVVRRGYVEVRAAGVAMTDADVGDALPVQLRASGRVVRATLLGHDEALALEDGQ